MFIQDYLKNHKLFLKKYVSFFFLYLLVNNNTKTISQPCVNYILCCKFIGDLTVLSCYHYNSFYLSNFYITFNNYNHVKFMLFAQ